MGDVGEARKHKEVSLLIKNIHNPANRCLILRGTGTSARVQECHDRERERERVREFLGMEMLMMGMMIYSEKGVLEW